VDQLPFALTEAQRRAVAEIGRDLGAPMPMHRLLQGDVGSGKTVVALCALLTAVQGGRQGALMAPTEVLAEQHFLSVRALVRDLVVPDPTRLGGSRPLSLQLLTSRTPATERARLHEDLRSGALDLVVGTHALLTGDVRFSKLGVVVIDEQHRFGVEQREALRSKGRLGAAGESADPDLLVMTATPIPRTAAMAVFGDLDVTELDELPAGRAPVVTTWARTSDDERDVWGRVREEVAAGNRGYVVCPLVDGSERIQAKSATEELARLESGRLEGLRLGLVHGQLKAADRETVMERFRSGEVQVLVATTVIEVGVDVPEATVMVIEDADRFGIAQLHQLRGRVGRSHRPSWCFLVSGTDAPDATRRLEAIVSTTDGFELADVDLEVRGEGSVLGTRQKGRSDLKLASLRRADRPLVEAARVVAEEMLADDPFLEHDPSLAEEIRLFIGEDEAAYLLKS
jgi:ATP-dependent DNA helicase RecG